MYIFTDPSDKSPHTAFACDTQATAYSFYLATAFANETQISAPASTSASAVNTLTTTASVPSTAAGTTSASLTSSNLPAQPASSSNPKSKAWIAGAVIGPTAALAIIAGLAVWVWRLKRRITSQEAATTPGNAPTELPAGVQAQGQPVTFYYPPQANPQELPGMPLAEAVGKTPAVEAMGKER